MKHQTTLLTLAVSSIALATVLYFARPRSEIPAGPVLAENPDPSSPLQQVLVDRPAPSARAELQQIPETEQPAPAAEPVAAVDVEAAFKRRTFKELLDQFDGVPMEHTDWPGFTPQQLCPMLMAMSVAAVMDANGTSRPEIADGVRRDVHEGGRWEQAFDYNSREYRFNRGMFPVYDEFIELQRAEARRQEAYRREQAASTKPSLTLLADLPYPEDFMLRASQYAHAALALRP